jgi:hypothetical protein
MINNLVARMLNLDSTSTLDAWTLSLSSGWPVVLLVLLLVLATVGAVFLYVREKLLRPSVRTILAIIRVLAVAMLLIMMFRPVIKATITRLRKSAVLILVDRSDSMNIRDTRKEPTAMIEAGVALGHLPHTVPNRNLRKVFSVRESWAKLPPRHCSVVILPPQKGRELS